MDTELVELRVRGVSLGNADSMPLVILETARGDRSLAVPVGPFEASAIIIELEGILPPRPLTHDLLAAFFREGGFSLDRVELFGSTGQGPRGRLVYHRSKKHFRREVRPSDALALGLRLGALVLAEADLLTGRPHERSRDGKSWHTPRVIELDERRLRA